MHVRRRAGHKLHLKGLQSYASDSSDVLGILGHSKLICWPYFYLDDSIRWDNYMPRFRGSRLTFRSPRSSWVSLKLCHLVNEEACETSRIIWECAWGCPRILALDVPGSMGDLKGEFWGHYMELLPYTVALQIIDSTGTHTWNRPQCINLKLWPHNVPAFLGSSKDMLTYQALRLIHCGLF